MITEPGKSTHIQISVLIHEHAIEATDAVINRQQPSIAMIAVPFIAADTFFESGSLTIQGTPTHLLAWLDAARTRLAAAIADEHDRPRRDGYGHEHAEATA